MIIDKAQNLIDAIPEDLLGNRRLVRHFFYGVEKKLRCARKKIKQKYDNASFDMSNFESMMVVADAMLNHEELTSIIEVMESVGKLCNVEYDGLEVLLEEKVQEQKSFDPFQKYFSPGSFVRFSLTNQRFGYMLFVGGNEKDGYFFDCIAVCDNGELTEKDLDETPRLYRQPVQGIFNPHLFQYVGKSAKHHLPVQVPFRMSLGGYPSPEEIDDLANKHGFQIPLTDDDWLPLVKKIVDAGEKIYTALSRECIANINIKNKVVWKDGLDIPIDQKNKPMPFGTFARIENLNTALIGGLDELSLMDKAF